MAIFVHESFVLPEAVLSFLISSSSFSSDLGVSVSTLFFLPTNRRDFFCYILRLSLVMKVSELFVICVCSLLGSFSVLGSGLQIYVFSGDCVLVREGMSLPIFPVESSSIFSLGV